MDYVKELEKQNEELKLLLAEAQKECVQKDKNNMRSRLIIEQLVTEYSGSCSSSSTSRKAKKIGLGKMDRKDYEYIKSILLERGKRLNKGSGAVIYPFIVYQSDGEWHVNVAVTYEHNNVLDDVVSIYQTERQ